MFLSSEHFYYFLVVFVPHIAASLFIANFTSQSHFHCTALPLHFIICFFFNSIFSPIFLHLHLHYSKRHTAQVPGSVSLWCTLSSRCLYIFKWFCACVCWSTSLSQVQFDKDDDGGSSNGSNKTRTPSTCTRVVGVQDNGNTYNRK